MCAGPGLANTSTTCGVGGEEPKEHSGKKGRQLNGR